MTTPRAAVDSFETLISTFKAGTGLVEILKWADQDPARKPVEAGWVVSRRQSWPINLLPVATAGTRVTKATSDEAVHGTNRGQL